MFDQDGLSLDQAPPIGVVLRFFLAGTLWGIVGGIWLMFQGGDALDPAKPAALILTHILTLGVMLSFMLGALFQMLPVLAGIRIQAPVTLAIRTHYPLMLGTLFLLLGFGQGLEIYYVLALVFLVLGIGPAWGYMLTHLQRVATHSPSSRGMAHALFNAGILLLLGIILIGLRNGWWANTHYLQLHTAHVGYGLLGWIGMLILSVSYQVVVMFYVTPSYPKTLMRWLTSIVTWLLVGGLLAGAFSAYLQAIFLVPALFGMMMYGIITLRRFSQRKRPLTDATVWFWRMGAVGLIVSMGGAVWLTFFPNAIHVSAWTALAFGVFALSVVLAMGYKIVPFLVWFHLNAKGYFAAPMMHEVIHPKYAMRHLWIHVAMTLMGLLSVAAPVLWPATGGLLALSFGWLGAGIYRAWHRYLDVERTGEKFSFGFSNQ